MQELSSSGKKFTEGAADSLIPQFKDTIGFAKLRDSDKRSKDETPPTDPPKLPAQEKPGSQGGHSGQKPPMTASLRYLPIPLDIGDAPIPVGMSEDDFQLLLDTLQLWKKKIVTRPRRAIRTTEIGREPVMLQT